MTRLQELVCVLIGHKFNQFWWLDGKYQCGRCGLIQSKKITIEELERKLDQELDNLIAKEQVLK